jgi:hypothetical protein
MKAIRVSAPGGLDSLELIKLHDPDPPQAGEVRVRLRATSLNYHDYRIVAGETRVTDARIPMLMVRELLKRSATACTVLLSETLSCRSFNPTSQAGPLTIDDFSQTPRDGTDG